MRPGEKFEIECYKYLNDKYKNKSVTFVHEGGMDSTKSDIAVMKKGRIDFYIEAKDAAAQSGQFVLKPIENMKIFEFSKKNHSVPNEMTNMIIEYMNNHFERFSNAGTAGEKIDIDKSVFSSWIVKHYEEKGVKYVISKDYNYVILPIRKFSEYFDISATYRIKKSGSGSPAKRDIISVSDEIKRNYPNAEIIQIDKKLYANISETIVHDRFLLGKHTYYFSEKGYNRYEITRLSNTYNMNVIFSIKLNRCQELCDLEEFEADL